MLKASTGHGAQPLHYDKSLQDTSAALIISVVLFCVPTISTHVPVFPEKVFRWPALASTPQLKREFLFERQFYVSEPVLPGELLCFRGDVPHFGPANLASTPRYVMFDMISPEPSQVRDQDAYQTFEWLALSEMTPKGAADPAVWNSSNRAFNQDPLGMFGDINDRQVVADQIQDGILDRLGLLHISADDLKARDQERRKNLPRARRQPSVDPPASSKPGKGNRK